VSHHLLLKIAISLVQGVLEADHSKTVCEVLHKLFEIDALVTINISSKAECDDLLLF